MPRNLLAAIVCLVLLYGEGLGNDPYSPLGEEADTPTTVTPPVSPKPRPPRRLTRSDWKIWDALYWCWEQILHQRADEPIEACADPVD